MTITPRTPTPALLFFLRNKEFMIFTIFYLYSALTACYAILGAALSYDFTNTMLIDLDARSFAEDG